MAGSWRSRQYPLLVADRHQPANVDQLQVAWTYDSQDAFKASEMQSNPIVVDGLLYATTPTMKVVALNAETGARSGSSIRAAVRPRVPDFVIAVSPCTPIECS